MREGNDFFIEMVFLVELPEYFVIGAFTQAITVIYIRSYQFLLLADAVNNEWLAIFQQLLIIVIIQVKPVFGKTQRR